MVRCLDGQQLKVRTDHNPLRVLQNTDDGDPATAKKCQLTAPVLVQDIIYPRTNFPGTLRMGISGSMQYMEHLSFSQLGFLSVYLDGQQFEVRTDHLRTASMIT